MWVIIPTAALLAVVAAQSAVGSTEPLNISEAILPADDQGRNKNPPAISLEYKPIKPFYQSSGSNVAQIVPPGQPWPASAAGYANFSQVNPTVPTKLENNNEVPLLQAAPTPSSTSINLDIPSPSTPLAPVLERALATELANVHISNKQQTVSTILNITPPPNANMDFVKDFQTAVRVALSKLVPSAGTSLRIAITKSSSGAIVNVKANLDIIIPAAVKQVSLPPSTVPEIDLQKGSSGLLQSLQTILLKELSQAGYNPDSNSVQKFSLSFGVLPPEGATKDFVRQYVLGPLQSALRYIAPGAALTSVSVNTQESNHKILRQIVKLNVQVVPPPQFQINENVVEVPEINLNGPGTNVASVVVSTLQDQIMKNAAINPTQPKTLSIPFKITPPAGATKQQIQDLYITPISQVLSKLDPTGKILKIKEETLPNGDIIILIYMNIPSNATSNPSGNGQIEPVVVTVSPQTTATSKSVPTTGTTSTEAQTPVSINNRNGFPEGEEDEIPPEINESTESEITESPQNEKVVPTNAIRTPVVDLTTPTASVNNIQRILDGELSPLTNPTNDQQPKVLAIPFRMKPPAGATLQQIEENVVAPIGKLLSTLEPTGNVITSQTEPLPNGDVESVVYFNIPSVENSKTYKVISDEVESSSLPSTIIPGASTQAPVTPSVAQEPVIPVVTKSPQTQVPNVKLPEKTIETTPIDLSHPNFDILKDGIEKRLKEAIKSKPPKNGEPQTIDFSFVVPKDQATRIPVMAQAIATLLKGLVPSGKAAPTLSPKVLPDGNVQFNINYEIPTIPVNKPNANLVEEQTKPSVAPKVPKALPGEKLSKIDNEVQLKNTVLTQPIVIKQTKLENLPSEIQQRVSEARKNSNGQPQVVGIPFVLSDNQKPSFIFTKALEMTLKTLEPSGNILRVSEPKPLPNGDTEIIFYDEFPAVTKEEPSKKVVKEPTKPIEPIVSKVIPKNENPQSQNEVPPPKNAVIVEPIDLTRTKFQELPLEIQQRVNAVRDKSNGQPQVIGFPFILPFEKPSFIVQQSFKIALKTLLPGKIVQVSEPKALPNGGSEFIIYDELPAVNTEKPPKEVEGLTKPSVESIVPKVIPEAEKPQPKNKILPKNVVTVPEAKRNELQPPKNAVVVAPIDLSQIKIEDLPEYFENIKTEIEKRLDAASDTSNGRPQVIGFPFILPFKENPSFLIQQGVKTMLKALLPSGSKVQESEPKLLPNGETEIIFYDELPAVNTEKSLEEVEETTKPSVESIESKFMPETTQEEVKPKNVVTVPGTKQPQPQNEVTPPKNAVLVTPIDLSQTKLEDLSKEIQQRVDTVKRPSDGQPQVIGFPFILPFENPSFLVLHGLKTMLKSLLPGNIVQVSEPKVLPNGGTELIFYDELPAVASGKHIEKEIKKDVKDDEKSNESIVFPTEPSGKPKEVPAKIKEKNVPAAAVEDVNLDEPGATVAGEVAKALTKAISTVISSKPNNLNEPVNLKFNVYAPLDNSKSQNKKLVKDVSSELKSLEPSAKVVTAKSNEKPQSNEPDGVVEIAVPSIASLKTAQNLKNALKVPTVDINIPQTQLVINIKDLLAKGLKSIGQLNPDASQLFDLSFRLNPFDTKGSVNEVLTALKAVDPKGQVVSDKIRSGPDGFDYLDVVYLIPKLEDSIIYEIVKPAEPEVIYESFVNIDTKNPLNNLLENVIKEIGAAEDEVQGARKEQLVDLPLDFKFTNSRGLSDSRVSEIISQTLPTIEGYISQILPDGKIQSVDTVALPNSDDVVLKIVVRTPYEPDNDIVIEEVRPQVRTVVTTPKPKSKGLFGLFGR